MLVDKTALLLCVSTSLAMPAFPRLEQYHLLQEPILPQLAELFKTPHLHWPISPGKEPSDTHTSGTSSSRTGKNGPSNSKSEPESHSLEKNKSDKAAASPPMAYAKTNSETNTDPLHHVPDLVGGEKGDATTTTALNDLKIITANPTTLKQASKESNTRAHPAPHRQPQSKSKSKSKSKHRPQSQELTAHPLNACLFTPHHDRRTHSQSLSRTIAWSSLSSLLLETTTNMLSTPTHRRRNLVETIHLGPAFEDRSLENVYLGVTYTRNGTRGRRPMAARDETEEEKVEKGEREVLSCLSEAVQMLSEQGMGMLEGNWEVPDKRGRIGFLIWRID